MRSRSPSPAALLAPPAVAPEARRTLAWRTGGPEGEARGRPRQAPRLGVRALRAHARVFGAHGTYVSPQAGRFEDTMQQLQAEKGDLK